MRVEPLIPTPGVPLDPAPRVPLDPPPEVLRVPPLIVTFRWKVRYTGSRIDR